MGVLGRVMAVNDTSISFTPATYDEAFRDRVPVGLVQSPELAMRVAAVYACTTVIAETTATLPLPVYQYVGEDGRRAARNMPLWDLLNHEPNPEQTATDFREFMAASAFLRGRGIAEIIAGPRGPVDQLKPIHPDNIRREIVASSGAVRYRYADPYLRRDRILLPDELFIVRGRFDRSVLDYARRTFSLAATLEGHAYDLFTRGARTSGALSHPKTLTDTARKHLREELDAYTGGGDKSGRPMLLEEGLTWGSIGMSAADAEFIATHEAFGVVQICRFARVPQHKIQSLGAQTNNIISGQSIDYVVDTILPWTIRIDQAIRRDLIVAKQAFFVEHNIDGLLRGDTKARYDAYALGRQWGWLSTNDIRRRENLNPIVGGDDDYLVPANIVGAPAPGTKAYLQSMLRDVGARLYRREIGAIARLAERTGGKGPEWSAGVATFYGEHGALVGRLLHLPAKVASSYAADRSDQVIAGGAPAVEDSETSTIAELTELALDNAAELRIEERTAA